MKLKYKEMVFDDFTKNENHIENNVDEYWTQICKSCTKKHEIEEKLLDEAGSGICGVEGCENESDYYLDFPKGIVVEIILYGERTS
ncbi:hypothetical protein FACS1894111_06070 [Clostridia bacterium]|nr:hypothetical protein FACS1894111_06070 [Clostridia bacterium]